MNNTADAGLASSCMAFFRSSARSTLPFVLFSRGLRTSQTANTLGRFYDIQSEHEGLKPDILM